MTLDRINVGFLPDDGTGDPERAAFQATNEAIDVLDGHVRDVANPHGVTAKQVDAYSKAEVDTRIQNFLTQVAAGTVSPAQLAQAVAGITIGASNTSITFAVGEAHSLFLTPETRSAFKPGTFSALSRVSTSATYGVIQSSSYNSLTGELVFTVVSAFGGPGPFNDWQVASLAASTLTQVGLVGQGQAAQSAADASRIEARDWATKTTAEVVVGLGFGAKKYASDASGSATAAGFSAALSQAWATQANGEVVTGQGYSAKYYAGVAQAAAQAAGGIQPSGSFVAGRLLAAGNAGGTSAADSGVTGKEALLPVQTVTAASKAFTAADLYAETRRANAGAAMADTLPASNAASLVNGSRLRIHNAEANGSGVAHTIAPGSGTTLLFQGASVASVSIDPGRTAEFVYDAPNTAWRATGNSLSALLIGNGLSEIAGAGAAAQLAARTNIGATDLATLHAMLLAR